MSAQEIARRVAGHNVLKWVAGIGLIPASAVLWWLSFWFFRVAFAMPLSLVMDGAWEVTWYVAWLCMIPLAVEGVRHAGPLFDLGEYAQSGYYDNFLMQSESGYAWSRYFGHPTAVAYWVTQVMYAAPRCLLMAIGSFRALLPADRRTAEEAARILEELRELRKWTPAANYREHGAALLVLDQLGLIWTEDKSGELEIRYPPGGGGSG